MTRARIWGATIFVDYATKWVKVHLMQQATGDETLDAKEGFEHAVPYQELHLNIITLTMVALQSLLL